MGNRIYRLLPALLLAMSLTLVSSSSNSSDSKNSSNSSSRAVSYLREKSLHLPHLLQRQKRWLIFELGTSVTLTANCAKALVGTIPRGLVLLAESTSIYEMPGAIEDWFPRRKGKPKPPPPPPPPPPVPPPPPLALALPIPTVPSVPAPAAPLVLPQQRVLVPLSPADPVHSFYYTYPQVTPVLGHNKAYVNQVQSGCPASNLVEDAYGNYYCQPTAAARRLRREFKRNGAKLWNQGQNPHGMLFDLLGMLSEIHQYHPRYCIMRTLCESRHLLAPPGHSLFHDIFRILLRYVHPEIAHKPTYRRAFTTGHSLHECAQWYGAHCPQSFLLRFSEQFRRKFVHSFNKAT